MTCLPGIPEDVYDILRTSMFEHRTLDHWDDETLGDPEGFIELAFEEGEVMDELGNEYTEAEVRDMLRRVFDEELREYHEIHAYPEVEE